MIPAPTYMHYHSFRKGPMAIPSILTTRLPLPQVPLNRRKATNSPLFLAKPQTKLKTRIKRIPKMQHHHLPENLGQRTQQQRRKTIRENNAERAKDASVALPKSSSCSIMANSGATMDDDSGMRNTDRETRRMTVHFRIRGQFSGFSGSPSLNWTRMMPSDESVVAVVVVFSATSVGSFSFPRPCD